MNSAPDPPAGATPPWRSFHHVALATPDLDATLAFYGMVLSMEMGEIMTRGGIRHCMVKPGDGEAWGLHFFEDPRAQLFTDREEMRVLFADPNSRFGSIPGALQHIAFSLPHET